MAKQNRPVWFRIYLHQLPLICSASDETLGRALKAAMCYFDTGELPVLPEAAQVLFSGFRAGADESWKDYRLSVENGKKGGRPKENANY